MSELAITYLPPGDLKPYERNARQHSADQVRQIRASIDAFGFTNPVLVDEKRRVIAGHGRQLAALLAPALETVPTIEIAGLTDEKRRALILADNKLALNAGWDLDLLRGELLELSDGGFTMDLTGFSGLELTDIFSTKVGATDPDDTPPIPTTPVTVASDIWILGAHRLICGDSTDEATVKAVLAGAKPHLMVTDPPYGVEYDPDWRNRATRSDGSPIAGSAIGTVSNDDRDDWSQAWDLFQGDVAYCWHAGQHASNVQSSLEASKFKIRAQIIWAKQQFAIGRGDYHFQHEPCWYAVRQGKAGHWQGDRTQSTLWQIPKPQKSETGHSTQKPVECMKRPIINNSAPGESVYEPFSGSGTTIIAAEITGRACFAIELNPAYVDVAVKRWQEFTGKSATLQGDGRTFDEIARERIDKAAA